jgi:hypothetical protein
MQNISLYIPHVFANFTKEFVAQTFSRLNIGDVERVDFIAKMGSDGKPYNAAYVHFLKWYDNSTARNLQEKIVDPVKQARLMYDDPWFWILLENKAQKVNPGDRKKRISLEGLTTPEKQEPTQKDMTKAPVKDNSYKLDTVNNIRPLSLQEAFEAAGINNTPNNEEQELDEIEELMDEEDGHLITIDGRYVNELEKELAVLRQQLAMLIPPPFQRVFY